MEPLRPDQQRAAALTLAEAFANDPLLEIVAPDPVRRARIAPAFMAVPLAYGMRYGRVWTNDDTSALAIGEFGRGERHSPATTDLPITMRLAEPPEPSEWFQSA